MKMEGNVVVVGVRFDGRSKELLTWALVKIAQPGDRIIALHVLDTVADSTASLLSLVKTFDAMLSVYEGFCNLKQVDLKLKVCRGSVRKILVREAKLCGAAALLLGTSKAHHTIRSNASTAKYCARKLPKSISVYAVDNGKILFRREASAVTMDSPQGHELQKRRFHLVHQSSGKTLKGTQELNHAGCRQASSGLSKSSGYKSPEEVPAEETLDDTLALVPVQASEADSGSRSRSGWPMLRRAFLLKGQNPIKACSKRAPIVRWVSRLRGRHSSAAIIYPDQKQSQSNNHQDHSSSLDGENGAIVPFGSESSWSLQSSCSSFETVQKELEGLHERCSAMCRLFNYKELASATSNFSAENIAGKGGSGYVYRGCLPDGKELAVKILKPSIDVVKEFMSEIDVITSLHHSNIISLFGYCYEDSKLILVYDFLARGSLEDNLHGNRRDPNLFGWSERYKVAIGVAEALEYLHCGREEPVIHRDVKSSNILLSDDFEPQLSDFGFASRALNTSSHVTCSDVAGTFGYLAPEYFMHGRLTDKIDVYAYGVVLLELLSGRKPIDSRYTKGQESLVMWAKPILDGGKISQLLDPVLSNNHDGDQLERMVLAATLCIRRAPRLRPQMSLVLKLLRGDAEVKNWAQQQITASTEECDAFDGETFSINIQSHLNLALLDINEDDSPSVSSPEQSISIEDYLKGRWSRASSFD